VAEIEIGIGKSARRGLDLDELTIVPSRRTRDPEDVDISWQLDAYRFDLPLMAAPLDGVVSPSRAIAFSELGGLAVLDLEGLWTRYEDPTSLLEEIAHLPEDKVTRRLQEIYAAPLDPDLVKTRIAEISATGAVTCGAITPQRTAVLAPVVLEAELDVLCIRAPVVSAEHVSKHSEEPLNLKRFIRELDLPVVVGRCSSYQAALHLMRTGAIGVLVGVGTGEGARNPLGIGAPQATAIADAAGARSRHLEETGVYVQVIADGRMASSGEIAKAIACGADAVMLGSLLAATTDAPAAGAYWPKSAAHATLPRGGRRIVEPVGTLAEVVTGPGLDGEGRTNLVGALRASMALCGYATIREFHKAEVVAGPLR
jgi:IMP dehydrogenase